MSLSFAWKLLVRATPVALALLCLPEAAGQRDQTEARLRRDVTFLASPACEGRGPGTKGIDRAAAYVARRLGEAGLKPGAAGGWFQPFRIAAADATLTLKGPNGRTITLAAPYHFAALGIDQKADVTAPLVFAGYGLACKESGYDDYAGLDVAGRIVVVLRETPRAAGQRSLEMIAAATLEAKLLLAMKHGAAAVLIVNDAPAAQQGDALPDYSFQAFLRGRGRPPALFLRRSVLEMMLPAGTTLTDIEKAIDRTLKPVSRRLPGWTATLRVEPRQERIPLKNVVGVLEGAGPLARETVVIGAHYDHLGYGSPSTRGSEHKRVVHPGADDNASGTAALIELARRFAALPNRQGRRLVFIAFSGEEAGLFGSEHYCKHPLFPLSQTAAMLNLDMVGRLGVDPKSGKASLHTQGHGTAKPFGELIEGLAKKHDFTLKSSPSGFGPSDHASFASKRVPVLFFWTGAHDDYHRPTDTADKVNVAGMRRVVDLAEDTVRALAQMERPAYVEVKGGTPVRPTGGPRLGIRPGYLEGTDGVEVEMVLPGGPAQKGGVRLGDRITSIAGKPVKNLGDYMQALAVQKKGSTIEVVVQRGGKPMKLKVPLE